MAEERSEQISEWRIPETRRPLLASELESKVEDALRTARASEAAVMSVGAAALDAAEQARRAADLAEQASAAALAAAERTPPPPLKMHAVPLSGGRDGREEEGDSLRDFSARADRVAARLRQLQAPAAAS